MGRWSVSLVAAAAVAAAALLPAPRAGSTSTTGRPVAFSVPARGHSNNPRAVTFDLLELAGTHGAAALPGSTPVGYGPADLQAAYHLASRSANIHGGLIAIVDPFDDPYAESDLLSYRAYYGLPACTTANGCFHKVNQDGSSDPADLPEADASWFREVSVDLDMASAICPLCQILLVEANDIVDENMYAAEDYATAHAKFVSNSWSNPEDSSDSSNDAHFDRPGVVITVSTGDTGSMPRYPATN